MPESTTIILTMVPSPIVVSAIIGKPKYPIKSHIEQKERQK